ncbi:MAG: bacA [Pseudonocardiales bacterium]|nr:bacA [Pseudonocardiales bacterium]
MSGQLSWLEAGVIGATQGVTELFPVSSLGHSVLIPAVIGGSWARDLSVSAPESPYLAFIVGLHVATALALIVYFRRDWARIMRGLGSSIVRRQVSTDDERLAWLLIIATIPVGIAGLLLEHTLRTVLAKPSPTAVFLIVNGLVLFAAERWRRASDGRTQSAGGSVGGADSTGLRPVDSPDGESRDGQGSGPGPVDSAGVVPSTGAVGLRAAPGSASDSVSDVELDSSLSRLLVGRAMTIGVSQILALAPGISRSGVAMATGLNRGLNHDTSARFSFLLATPVILAAGVLKLPDLFGPLGDGIRGQVLFGSVLSGIAAYLSVRFLSRYFEKNSLRPFGWYCVIAGAAALILVNR